MIPFLKKNKDGRKPPKSTVPRTAQESIPFQRMFEDGTCRVRPGYYTRTIQYQDINYQLAQQEDKTAIFEEWCSFLNFFDSSIHFELSFVNTATDSADFEKSIRIPYQQDGFDDVRAEYSQMLRQQLSKGNNGLTKTKFLTYGIEGDSMAQVKPRLEHIQNDLMNNFHRLGVLAKPLDGTERLRLMHGMLNMDGANKFHFNWKDLVPSGLSVKDAIAPTALAFKNSRTFQMGGIFGAVSFLNITASDLSDQLLKDFLDMDSSQIVTMHIQSVDQNKAIKTIKHTITELDRSKIEEQKKAVRAGYDMDVLPSDLATYGRDAKALLKELQSQNERKLKFEEEKERTATRSPPKKSKVEQSVPKKQKLKQDADKAAEKSQHLRFGKAEITPDEASRMTKQQKRAMYAAAAARSAAHREIDQYEDDNVGTQALSEGEKAAETTHDISKSRYARKLKKKAKMQGKKRARTAKSSVQKPPAAQDAGASGTGEGSSNWLSRWKQRQEIRKSHYATAHSGTAAQTAGGKAVSNGTTAAKSGMEQVIDKGKSVVSTAVNGIANFAKSNAHVLLIVGVFLLLLLLVMSAFSSCSILFSGTTQVSGQTIYTAEDRDIRGAETDYKKLEKELDKKIKRTPTDHPGYNEYQYHLDPIEHDPWQLTSFLTTLYDDYTGSEVQGKLKETFKKQYKLTTWVEVQIRYKTVWVISPAGIPVPTQVPYEYRIFHTKLVNKGLEVVIREELDNDQWKRYEIFQDTLGGRPYLFNGGLPPGGSDGSGTPGIDYQVPAEALTDSEFAAIYKEAQKYVGTPYVWGGSTPETGFDCSGYVCWVYNQNGYNVGRTTANGLWNKSQHISEAEAKPGDLVFFEGTYDTPGKSHVGIYLGNGMMVSAGDPIKYANIHSSYWQKYLSGFGRLSK